MAKRRCSRLWLNIPRVGWHWGEGGYAIEVVPRAWTIAFGAMSGQNFPDELPLHYRKEYGGEWLHDHEGPPFSHGKENHLRCMMEQMISTVKELHHIV